ncbi:MULTISPECIES: cobalamin B12-binding domain-containing protein [unclassified Roseivivax]|uniref:cobalamin B12-binding domain-containing protein n=1 Tax=Roseivivax sp. GX 12232 TaxID=2900547 RepID=UPI001E436A6B|nr:cobalamin B12-binding domain-containing protein [Roseivivax sp. GX 12232]MCE0506246.1 cobalamin B12-binding domain-containing protein [Roseivivax sp. GX 12232]
MSDYLSNPSTCDEQTTDISALAGEVVAVLRDNTARRAERSLRDAAQRLGRRARATGPFRPEAALGELAQAGFTPDDVIDRCIPAAARELGALWVSDQLSFAEVTIGTARLQGLLTRLIPDWDVRAECARAPSLALIIPEGDTHTLGLHVVTAQLRRRGAAVRLFLSPDAMLLPGELARLGFDGILVSASRESSLDVAGRMIARLRHSYSAPPPIILGGLALDLYPGAASRAGADLVSNDAAAALGYCRGRMKAAIGAR